MAGSKMVGGKTSKDSESLDRNHNSDTASAIMSKGIVDLWDI